MADLLVLGLHARIVRSIARAEAQHFEGLGAAARHLWRKGTIDNRLKKKLLALESAYNVTRHITEISSTTLADRVTTALAAPCAEELADKANTAEEGDGTKQHEKTEQQDEAPKQEAKPVVLTELAMAAEPWLVGEPAQPTDEAEAATKSEVADDAGGPVAAKDEGDDPPMPEHNGDDCEKDAADEPTNFTPVVGKKMKKQRAQKAKQHVQPAEAPQDVPSARCPAGHQLRGLAAPGPEYCNRCDHDVDRGDAVHACFNCKWLCCAACVGSCRRAS